MSETAFVHISELRAIVANSASDCPTCVGCRVYQLYRAEHLCQNMIDQGLCQKQLWREYQERRLMLAAAAAGLVVRREAP